MDGTRASCRAAGVVLLPALLGACGGTPAEPTAERPPARPVAVPRPDTSALEPLLAARLEALLGAAEALERRGDATPGDLATAFGELGERLAAYGFLEAAEAAFTDAEAAASDDPRWPHFRGLVAIDAGDLEAAAGHFRRVLALHPDDPAALAHLGNVLLELDRPAAARRAFSRLLELRPDAAVALYGLGRLDAAAGDDRTAAARFTRVLELAPEASAVRYPLAQVYRRLGREEAARRQLAARGDGEVPLPDPLLDELGDLIDATAFEVVYAQAADPGRYAAEDVLGFALAHLGRVAGTLAPLERFLADLEGRAGGLDPTTAGRLHYVLGGLAVNAGDDRRAVGHFRAAVALEPDLAAAHLKLANALARAGRRDEAVAAYTRVLELEPENVPARRRRAALWLAAGRSEAAIDELRRLAAREPEAAEPRLELADALTAAGRFGEAEMAYRDALRHGAPAAAYLGLARLAGHLGRPEDALAGYRAALARQPDLEEAVRGEVTALLVLGRRAEARRCLEARLAAGEDPPLAHALARLLAAAPEPELRDGARAVALARPLLTADRTADRAATLALAYAAAGRLAEAVALQSELVARLGAAASAVDRQRLAAYRAGHPWSAHDASELIVAEATPAGAG